MIYSIPYVLLILIFGFFSIYYYDNKENESKKYIIDVWCIVIFILFFGFRGFICDDWISYYPAFQKCSFEYVNLNVFEYNIEWGFEPGFTLLMCLCKIIMDDYQILVLVCTLINTFLLFKFFQKRIDNMPLGIILFLSFGGYIMSTNLMRNSIAILIFINSLTYLERRKPLQYFGLCLLALTFHISAVIYFPLYFFFNIKLNKWVYLSLFVFGNVIFLFHVPLFLKIISLFLGDSEGQLQMMVESYTSGDMAEMKTLSIGYLERLFTGILIFCYYNKLTDLRKENIIFINAFICYILASFLFSEFSEISLRLSYLFIFAYWILWYDLINCFSILNNKKLFLAFMSIYFIMKMVGSTNMITSSYDNVIFGAKSYEERLYIHNRYSKN